MGSIRNRKGKKSETKSNKQKLTETTNISLNMPRNNRRWWLGGSFISLAIVGIAVAIMLVTIDNGKQVSQQSTPSPTIAQVPDSRSTVPSRQSSATPSSKPSIADDESAAPSITTSQLPEFTSFGTFEVLKTVPHDTNAFTQGLQIVDGTMYESNGLYGKSNVRILEIDTGNVLKEFKMADRFFGEGMTHFVDSKGNERLLQLTWKEQTAFLYDPETLLPTGNFTYTTSRTEGWGITYDPKTPIFYVSDGSNLLHLWDAKTFEEVGSRISVEMKRRDTGEMMEVPLINELEWDHHSRTILANVFLQNVLIRIDPATGFVITVYDFTQLYTDRTGSEDVFNGIAVTETSGVVWVTGKLWPNMYLVRLLDR